MDLLTAAEKTQVQQLYSKIVVSLKERYGGDTSFEGARFQADDDGNVINMWVEANIAVTDVDGDVVRSRKRVDVWNWGS